MRMEPNEDNEKEREREEMGKENMGDRRRVRKEENWREKEIRARKKRCGGRKKRRRRKKGTSNIYREVEQKGKRKRWKRD